MNRLRAGLVLLLLLSTLYGCNGEQNPPAPPRMPILETMFVPSASPAVLTSKSPGRIIPARDIVVTANQGQVVPRSTGGEFHLEVTRAVQLRLRVDFAEFAVEFDGQTLPVVSDNRDHPELDQSGYFLYSIDTLPSGPLTGPAFFAKLTVIVPSTQRPLRGEHVITVRSVRGSDAQSLRSDPLEVRLLEFTAPDKVRRPSTVFDDGGENAKGFWSREAIVAPGVTLAGWLQEGEIGRNDDNGRVGPGASEDWHYTLWLDNDFIERNYGADTWPLNSGTITGNGHMYGFPIGYRTYSLLNGQPPTADRFMLPGSNTPNFGPVKTREAKGFTVELNAWHMQDTLKGQGRGNPPSNWTLDPDAAYTNNAWPFNPLIGVSGTEELKPGDYVIITGTLWQDSSHEGPDQGDYRSCWEDLNWDHGGWLEIHPVDRVERVESPPLRRHVGVVGACAREGDIMTVDTKVSPLDGGVTPPNDRSVLKFREIIDERFTRTGTYFNHSVQIDRCDPTSVRVRVRTVGNAVGGNGGGFKATYILWWENGTEVRQVPTDCPVNARPGSGPSIKNFFPGENEEAGEEND